jgi:protein-tyrosine-phosphatase
MRGWLFLLLGAATGAQTAQNPPEVNSSTIVFVCEHGAAKRVIAAAHFNRLASEKGLPYRAVPRGIKPEGVVAPAVKAGLASEGLDVSGWRPKAVSDEDIKRAKSVISLATDLLTAKPLAKTKLMEWNAIPAVSENYDAARGAIVKLLTELVEKLAERKN